MSNQDNSYKVGMTAFGAIFFIFGFATTFIVTLTAPVKEIFGLSEFGAQLLSSAFFIAYPIMSIPTGRIIDRIGYKWAVIVGLLLMALGSFIYIPAAQLPSFPIFLFGTFVLATGGVFLQVAAVAADRVPMPFIVLGVFVVLVAFAIYKIKLPVIINTQTREKKSILKYPHVVLGAVAIFFYVGAEVGNAGLIVNYLKSNLGFSSEEASTYAAIYWGGAMIGRFFGSFMFSEMKTSKKYLYAIPVLVLALISGSFVTSWNWNIGLIFTGVAAINFFIMQFGRGKAARTLAVFALIAAILDLTTSFTTGNATVALWTIISIGLFNSIMFPNIFTLAVKDLDNAELSGASGLINALILGGAIIPLIMGGVADSFGYTWAFIVPAICYLYIFYYAVKGSTIRR